MITKLMQPKLICVVACWSRFTFLFNRSRRVWLLQTFYF